MDDNATHSARLLSVNATFYRSNDAYGTVEKSELQEASEVVQNQQERWPSADNLYCEVKNTDPYCEVKDTDLTTGNNDADYVI